MDRSRILAIGCGGCGNSQLSTLMDLDIRYSGIFMNTNLSEMENLKHFDRTRRSFYIANADGTGKDRNVAERYIKEDAPKFVEMIQRYVNQDYVLLMGSMNGGTGSKAIIILSKLIKKFCPNKSINIITTFPDINLSDIDYENTIDTWNELIKLKNSKNKIIDSIQFIDNNKSSNLQQINVKAMKELNDSLDIVGGNLDASDSRKVHTSNGYKVILHLDPRTKDTKEAINQAMKSSMFYTPENFECNVMIGNINTNIFDLQLIKSTFEAYDFTKFNHDATKSNIIVLGGCDLPTEGIELTKEALKELQRKKKQRTIEDDLIIKRKDNDNIENDEIAAIKDSTNSRLSSKDLNNIFADDNFWDD